MRVIRVAVASAVLSSALCLGCDPGPIIYPDEPDLAVAPADLAAALQDAAAPADLAPLRDASVSCTNDWDCRYPNRRCDVATAICVPCLPMKGDCGYDAHCAKSGGGYACAPGCEGDGDCYINEGGTMACCNGKCTGLESDRNNCQKCGNACKQDEACCYHVGCANLNNDAKNCGACFGTCPNRPNAAPACIAGQCGIGVCGNGYGDCNKIPADGCERDLFRDHDNCGTCGVACAVNQVCFGGACK